MICDRCGNPIPSPEARFCPACGAPLAAPVPAAPAEPEIAAGPEPETPAAAVERIGSEAPTEAEPEAAAEPVPETPAEPEAPIAPEPEAPAEPEAAAEPAPEAPAEPEAPIAPEPEAPAEAEPETPAVPNVEAAPEVPAAPAPEASAEPAPALPAARVCPACGRPLPPAARFCTHCGAPLADVPAAPAAPVPPAMPAASAPAPPPAPQKTTSPLVWVLVGVVALLVVALAIAGILGYLLVQRTAAAVPAPVPTPAIATPAPYTDAPSTPAAPAATPAPTAPPADAILPTDIVLRGAPDGALLELDGQALPAKYVDGAVAVDPAALYDGCALRVITYDEAFGDLVQVVWYDAAVREYTLLDDGWMPLHSDGSFEPSLMYIDDIASRYYGSFLDAINWQDASLLRCCTATNVAEQSERVYSKDNAQSTWDIATYTCEVDADSVAVQGQSILFNVSYSATRTTRDTQEQALISNHRTIELVYWGDAWRINGIAFLSDEDFAAGNYADLHQ